MSSKKPTVGFLEFRTDGEMHIVHSKNVRGVSSRDLAAFELSARYLMYAMNRLDWMYDFVDEASKHGIDINAVADGVSQGRESTPLGSPKPALRVIRGGKSAEKKNED